MKILETNLNKSTMSIIFSILLSTEKKVIRLKHGFEGPEYSFKQIDYILDISKQSAYQYYWQGINRIRNIFGGRNE